MNNVGIVLATKGRAFHLNKMLDSLLPALQGVSYEIIVIKGDFIDDTSKILANHGIQNVYSESKYLGEGQHSWGELYNFGFKKCTSKWLMYCSDDIIFNKDCFKNAIEKLDKQPNTIAGGAFFYRQLPSDNLFKIYGVDYTYGRKLMINYGLIRSSAFWDVDGLEETYYKFYCADGDLCFKLFEAGNSIILLPKCLITHNKGGGASSRLHYSQSKKDINNYRSKWQKYTKRYHSLNPRRVWLKDIEKLEEIKKGAQVEKIVEKIDWRRFRYIKEQIAYGLADGDFPDRKEIWL